METRVVQITIAAVDHGRLGLKSCGPNYFPKKAFGGSSRANGLGTRLRLSVHGLNEIVESDIPTDTQGRPRWFFRERRWVRQFIRIHSLQAGSQVVIRRLSETDYEIAPFQPSAVSSSLFGENGDVHSNHSFAKSVVSRRRGKNGDLNKLEQADRPVHDWYRFVLSFPPHLVRDYVARLGVKADQVVLDPFCGTGTTVVECQKLGIRAVGIEANPLAHLASKTKVDWSPDPLELITHANVVAETALKNIRESGLEDEPTGKALTGPSASLRRLNADAAALLLANSISPLPLHKTLMLLDAIEHHHDSRFVEHERIALAKTVVFTTSNLHFGPEVGVTKPKDDAAVVAPWLSQMRTVAQDLRLVSKPGAKQARILHADARAVETLLEPQSIDAVITSPPYPNEKDYTRTTRLESVLLGFLRNKGELRALKRSLVRSNTRGVYRADDNDAWSERYPQIQHIADAIEARRIALGKTSGFERMYPRVTKLYFGGMARHLSQLTTVLKPGAMLAYVVGDQASYLRVLIRTGELLAQIGQSLGYELVGIDLFRTRLSTATREQLREEVVVLRWPGR